MLQDEDAKLDWFVCSESECYLMLESFVQILIRIPTN